jgi:two-component system, cell cycle sensor histidine kinase and response regulator CckA
VLGSRFVRRLLPGPPLEWEDRQTASAFLTLVAMVLATALVHALLAAVTAGAAADLVPTGAVVAATLGALLLLRRRRLRAAVWVFLGGLAAAGTLVLLAEGLSAPGLGNVMVVLVIAAILLNWRGALCFGLFFGVVLLGVQVAELRRWLLPQARPPATVWLSTALPVVLMTLLLAGATHWLRGVVLQLRRRERQLRAANDALSESREALSLVIDESPDAIIAAGDRGVIQLVNGAAERMLGYAAQELLGKPFLELGLVAPDSQARSTEEIGRVLAGMEGPPTEIEIVRKDGTRLPVEVNGRMVKRGDGSMQVQAVMRDIRERKQAERARQELEAELRQAQRLESVGRLAGGIAHDFNNLLTVILSTASSLKGQLPPDDLHEDVVAIEAAALRAAELTRQLLAFSRKQILRPQVIEPASVIEGVESILRRLLPEQIAIVVRKTAVAGAIRADPQQMQQVLINLALNARDAMPGPGTLTIAVDEVHVVGGEAGAEAGGELAAGAHVRFSVSDTGVGMDERTRAHLFEPFFTTKPVGQGTGLGLATAHGIVVQSGGHIRVRSREGEGSTFEVLMPMLPALVDDAGAAGAPGPAPAGAACPAESILLVEDEPLVRQTTARILRGLGYQVTEAGTAHEALRLAAARATPVDLLLTDVIMPGVSGPDLAARLSAQAPSRVLFMSGHADVPLAEAELLARSPFLAKPFSPLELARKVREALDRQPGRDVPAGAAPGSSPPGSTA